MKVIFQMIFSRSGYLIREGFRSIKTHSFMSFASVTIIMACLIIMGSVTLLSFNIDALIKNLEDQNEVVAFVDDAIADKEQVAAGGHITAKRLARAFGNVGEVPVRDDAERIREVGAPVGWPGVGHLRRLHALQITAAGASV